MAYYAFLLPGLLLLAGCGAEASKSASMAVELPATEPSGVAPERKIIYTATLSLVVEDFPTTERRLLSLVSSTDGYVATYRENRRAGGALGGDWVVRVPVVHFDRFLKDVAELGLPTSRQIDAQDVTEQYIDLMARLSTKKQLERRVLSLLEERTGAIQDVIEVEKQLGRIREEVEAIEGKIRYLSDQTSLTTVTISAREDKSYRPPQAPTFAAQVRQTFSQSFARLIEAGEVLVLAFVALLPWLLVAGLVLAPAAFWWQRRRKESP
jgi:hypothetical protein